MAINILVVDDSATMRKILEMTFAGEDAHVVAVPNAAAALAKAAEIRPDIVLADGSMKPDGYELAQTLRGQADTASIPVVLLASQQVAYDKARGTAAGIVDSVVKPFDTTALIAKVSEVVAKAREGAGASASSVLPPVAPKVPVPAAAAPARDLKRTMAFGTPLQPVTNPLGPVQSASSQAIPAVPAMPPVQPAKPAFAEPLIAKPPVVAPAAPRPPIAATTPLAAKPVSSATPMPAPAAPKPAAPVAAAPAASKVAAATAPSGELSQKLVALGLDAAQISGVLALSREVIEQVVWEVVPELAETLIREEIKRLTAD